jgi:hypothetical protein
MSSEQYFSYIQDKNKLGNILNYIEMMEVMGLLGQRLDCHWKSMESLWVGMKSLVFCNGYNVPTLFQNLHSRSL